MDKSRLDVVQLQRRDPVAWTELLHDALALDDLVVTAVSAAPLRSMPGGSYYRNVRRYVLTLADHSDPISFIGKRTNESEALFYQNIAPGLAHLAPRCLFASLSGDEAWLVLDDVPDNFPPHRWSLADIEAVIQNIANLHVAFWRQEKELEEAGISHFIGRKRYTLDELLEDQGVYFESGPAATLSEHAIHSAGRLAPIFLEAANGLAVIRELGGWPGVLGESHLTAAADLLDDPLPILEPLRRLPSTLLHGNPSNYHWRLTLFDEMRLFDWKLVNTGPGIMDLVVFLEQFDLLYDDGDWGMHMRDERPTSEETMIDSYLLAMSGQLGRRFNAKEMRQAIPAARCLYVLTHWFPHFAKWFSDMPNKYTWQKVNRMSDDRLFGTIFQPMIGFRPYLAATFARFLQASRTL